MIEWYPLYTTYKKVSQYDKNKRFKMDDRTKRRQKEMDKLKRDGTSTEFDKGYNQGVNDTVEFMKNLGQHTTKDMIKEIKTYQTKPKQKQKR